MRNGPPARCARGVGTWERDLPAGGEAPRTAPRLRISGAFSEGR